MRTKILLNFALSVQCGHLLAFLKKVDICFAAPSSSSYLVVFRIGNPILPRQRPIFLGQFVVDFPWIWIYTRRQSKALKIWKPEHFTVSIEKK